MSNRTFTYLCVGLVIGCCLIITVVNYNLSHGKGSGSAEQPGKSIGKLALESGNKLHSSRDPNFTDRQRIGGILRPKTDMIDGARRESKPNYPNPLERWGRVPAVDPERNRSTRLVAEAAKQGNHPERLSLFSRPQPFNQEQFEEDPQPYLQVIEPARIMQTARVNPDVTPIKRRGSYFKAMIQGETITLKAEVQPKMPVTFYAPGVGQFQNSLSTITVQADETGAAEVQFTAVQGTAGDIDVLAASPVHSHQVRYLIRVEIPEAPPKLSK